MIRIIAAALAILAAPASAGLTIGTTAFEAADVLDARALPEPGAPPIIMITFSDAGMAKLARATSANGTATIPVAVDGTALNELIVTAPFDSPVLTITGAKTVESATALAKAISGRDPLPETLED